MRKPFDHAQKQINEKKKKMNKEKRKKKLLKLFKIKYLYSAIKQINCSEKQHHWGKQNIN
jgi:hypothetical protein